MKYLRTHPRSTLPVLVAAVLAVASALPAAGQGLLDEQLGPTPPTPPTTPTPATPAPSGTAKPETAPPRATPAPADRPVDAARPTTPGTGDIISPDAVRRVDDADLINKLTQPEEGAKAENQAAEQMKQMIERMGQSQTRLTQIDPGDVTQETQRRIIADLDFFIELARKQQQQGQGQGQPQQQDQERQYSSGNQQGPNQRGSTPAQESSLPRGGQATPQTGEDIRAHGPEEWGKLRPKERDLISHGANEEYLSPYRDMIQRYYQALAELGKNKNK